MSRLAVGAAACATALVVAAGATALALRSDEKPALVSATSSATPSAPALAAMVEPSATPTATTATPVPPGPLTPEDGTAALPVPDGTYVAAAIPVQLASVCEGATLPLVNASPSYVSLQTAADPLRYLDAVVAQYDTVPSAQAAYDRLVEAVAACPPQRVATAAPTTPQEPPLTVDVVGASSHIAVGALPAVQWVQLQSGSESQLRTAVTLVAFENTVLAISMDADSETTTAEELAAASAAAALAVVERLTVLAAS